jgi:alpha-1,3-rhamnosyl/mannosyltransferase
MARKRKISIAVEGLSLAREHFSGVGHYALGISKGLEKIAELDSSVELKVTIPFRMVDGLNRHGLSSYKLVKLPVLNRLVPRLLNKGLMPPVDLFTRRSVLFFPDFVIFPTIFAKRIVVIHDLSFELVPEFVDSGNAKFLSRHVASAVKKADVVIGVSDFTSRSIVEHYGVPRNKVQTIPNGVEREHFYKRSKEEVEYVKAKYGINGDYIMFLGNLEPRKNLSGLIKAYKLLPKKITDQYALLLVGASGWLNSELFRDIQKARIEGFKIIRPEEYVDDLDTPAVYSGAACFVYPSHYEGFGIPVIEAMACGVPVVAANNSAISEVATGAAVMVDNNSPSSIAKGIEEVLSKEDLRKNLIMEGLKRAESYNWIDSARKLVEIVKKVKK